MESSSLSADASKHVSMAAQIATWHMPERKTAIDVVFSGHATLRATDDHRTVGSSASATKAYLTRFFENLPTGVREAIICWTGFPGQPPTQRSIYVRDLNNQVSVPVVFDRHANKVVIPTILRKEEHQKMVPCGGQKRMSLVIDFDTGKFSRKLRIGKYFVADTEENRRTQWSVEYTP